MGGLGDFVNTFRAGMRAGPTPVGTWGDLEKFGRLEGTGDVQAELSLPEGHLAVSVEDYVMVQELEAELTAPSGETLELKRYSESAYDDDDSKALKNLRRVVSATIEAPGIYQLRVKAPNGEEPLLIMAGEAPTPGDALKDMAGDMVPGAKLWKRLRGG